MKQQMRKEQRYGALALLMSLSCVGACSDPLKEPQQIQGPRVIGVRFANAADQSVIVSGEESQIEVLLTGPLGPQSGRLAYQLCDAADTSRGVPFCAGTTYLEGESDDIATPLVLAPQSDVPEAQRLAFLGMVCLASTPSLAPEPLDWSCSGAEEGIRLSFDASTAGQDVPNQNPNLSQVSLEIADLPLPADLLNDEASCSGSVPVVEAESENNIVIELGPDAREQGEELQLSHFSTRGLFERPYSFIEPDAAASTVVSWLAPEQSGPVKQYLVVRDGRGGVSWLSFSVCVERTEVE